MPLYRFVFLQAVVERLQTQMPADCEPFLISLLRTNKMRQMQERNRQREKKRNLTATKTDVGTKWAFSPILEIFAGMQIRNLHTCMALVFN